MWDEDEDFNPVDNKYYEREVMPKIERQHRREMAKCQHKQFFVLCSSCKHIIGSELNDPFEALKAHREKHEEEEKRAKMVDNKTN